MDTRAHFVIQDESKLKAISQAVSFYIEENKRSVYQKNIKIYRKANEIYDGEDELRQRAIPATMRQAGFTYWSQSSSTWDLSSSDGESLIDLQYMTKQEIEESGDYRIKQDEDEE